MCALANECKQAYTFEALLTFLFENRANDNLVRETQQQKQRQHQTTHTKREKYNKKLHFFFCFIIYKYDYILFS